MSLKSACMKIAFYFLVVFAAVVVLSMLVGLFYKRIVVVKRRKVIRVSPSELYRILSDFHLFVKWNPWSEKDPALEQHFEGTPGETGHAYRWKGNRKVGQGSMTMLAFRPNEAIDMRLDFTGRGSSKCSWQLQETAEGTEVRWIMESDMGKVPASRLFGPMMDKFVGTDFEKGLEKLKDYAEHSHIPPVVPDSPNL